MSCSRVSSLRILLLLLSKPLENWRDWIASTLLMNFTLARLLFLWEITEDRQIWIMIGQLRLPREMCFNHSCMEFWKFAMDSRPGSVPRSPVHLVILRNQSLDLLNNSYWRSWGTALDGLKIKHAQEAHKTWFSLFRILTDAQSTLKAWLFWFINCPFDGLADGWGGVCFGRILDKFYSGRICWTDFDSQCLQESTEISRTVSSFQCHSQSCQLLQPTQVKQSNALRVSDVWLGHWWRSL